MPEKVLTSHDYPPIPMRNMDWSAVMQGSEGDGPYGRGATEKAAVIDMLHELVADECSLEVFAAALARAMALELAEAREDGRNASYLAGYSHAMRTALGFV